MARALAVIGRSTVEDEAALLAAGGLALNAQECVRGYMDY
jgi:hypothetical protein